MKNGRGCARRLLVADNDRDLLFGVSEELARDDYDVSQAFNGFQALQMARELGPELMVVDEDIRGIGGRELCERLRADPMTRDMRLVLISSEPDSAAGAQADLCLAKPADCRAVARAVEELMG